MCGKSRNSPLPPTATTVVAPSNGIAAARDVLNDVLDGGGGDGGGGLVACQKCTLQNDRKLKVGFVLGILMGIMTLLRNILNFGMGMARRSFPIFAIFEGYYFVRLHVGLGSFVPSSLCLCPCLSILSICWYLLQIPECI